MVRTQPAEYGLSPDQLIALKSADVPDKVVAAAMERNAGIGASTTQSAGTASGATPSVGTAARTTRCLRGIYLYTKGRNPSIKMTSLERAAYQGIKNGGIKDHIPFASKHTRAIIPEPRAGIRTMDGRPEFYFYFEEKAAGPGKTYFRVQNLTNPNRFARVKLEVTKTNRRTVIFQSMRWKMSRRELKRTPLSCSSHSVRGPASAKWFPRQAFRLPYSFLAPTPLVGAYAAGAMGAVDIFDFAISEAQ